MEELPPPSRCQMHKGAFNTSNLSGPITCQHLCPVHDTILVRSHVVYIYSAADATNRTLRPATVLGRIRTQGPHRGQQSRYESTPGKQSRSHKRGVCCFVAPQPDTLLWGSCREWVTFTQGMCTGKQIFVKTLLRPRAISFPHVPSSMTSSISSPDAMYRYPTSGAATMQIFMKTLLTRRVATYQHRRIRATAGASVQIFVETLLCLLLTSRHDVSTPGERSRCLKPLRIFVKTLLGLLLTLRRRESVGVSSHCKSS